MWTLLRWLARSVQVYLSTMAPEPHHPTMLSQDRGGTRPLSSWGQHIRKKKKKKKCEARWFSYFNSYFSLGIWLSGTWLCMQQRPGTTSSGNLSTPSHFCQMELCDACSLGSTRDGLGHCLPEAREKDKSNQWLLLANLCLIPTGGSRFSKHSLWVRGQTWKAQVVLDGGTSAYLRLMSIKYFSSQHIA